ncbi:MAG: hypothetical protein MRY76_09695 [Pseudomonadales bacterium]|nr:hypothetical protein [Pseudomonadales bacterium]
MNIAPKSILLRATALALLALPLSVMGQQDHSGHGQSDHSSQAGQDAMQHEDGGGGSGMMRRMRRMAGNMGGMGGDNSGSSGQSALDVISAVISELQASPDTDWSRINIDALRQHLVDMDRVALYAQAEARDIEGGSEFTVSGEDERTVAAIKRMVPSHALQIERELGWEISSTETRNGMELQVNAGDDAAMIRALGFFGFMVLGEHHDDHHLMMAGGQPATDSGMNHGGGGGRGGGNGGGGHGGGNGGGGHGSGDDGNHQH